MRIFHIALISVFLILTMVTNSKANVTITDGDATTTLITPGGSWNWVLGPSGLDQSFQHWLYYRIAGDASEFEFPVPTTESVAGNEATLSWTNVDGRGFDATWIIRLNDIPGEACRIQTVLVITNTSGASLDIQVYEYTDLDLDSGSGGEFMDWITPNILRQDDGPTYAEVGAENFNLWEVDSYSTLRSKLEDGSVDDLGDTGTPYGPGDATNAFQWGFVIPDGGSVEILAGVGGNATYIAPASIITIPTMSQWALIILGLVIISLGMVTVFNMQRREAVA